MANLNLLSQQLLFNADPVEGFVRYANAVKPYHTKIMEALIEYVYTEELSVNMKERWDWAISLSRPTIKTVPRCGFGIVWDSQDLSLDYKPLLIKQAVGQMDIGLSFLSDIHSPTTILVSSNPYNYVISVNDPVTIRTTESMPSSSSGDISPGVIYYVTSVGSHSIEISHELGGAPLAFVFPGTGTITIHQENKQYNTFLVTPDVPTVYKAIVSNLKANQLTFVDPYSIVNVQSSTNSIIVSGVLLASAYVDLVFNVPITTGSNTGLPNTSAVFELSMSINGIIIHLSIVGSAAQTILALLSELNNTLGTSAEATIVGNSIRITSLAKGDVSTVSVVDITLLAAIAAFDGIAPQVNNTKIFPGSVVYVRDNTSIKSTSFTVATATVQGNTTKIQTIEVVPPTMTPVGTLNVVGGPGTTPRLLPGTRVQVSSSQVLPAPLMSQSDYFLILTDQIGVFTLATKRQPIEYSDTVDLSSYGSGGLSITRSETFYPGAVVRVSNTYNSKNNGTYIVQSTKREGQLVRVQVAQRVPLSTPTALQVDGVMELDFAVGYDFPQYCAPAHTSDLFAETFFSEHILFEYDIDFIDRVFTTALEDVSNPSVEASAVVPGYQIQPMGYDTQFLDVGPLDEDIFFSINHLQ